MTLLATLGLSADAIAARQHSIGGSDANVLMSGDTARIYRLWQEKRGEVAGEDLSDNLAVQMGSFTEPLNVAWFEKQTGRKVVLPKQMAGGGLIDPDQRPLPYMACTLDGWVVDTDTQPEGVFEAKHTGTRTSDADLFARYVPQLTHNCLCTGAKVAWLSAFKGNGDWVMFEYALDPDYAAALIEAEAAFWACVQSGEEPCAAPPVKTPKPVGVVEYDMSTSNAWTMAAAEYAETVLAAARNEAAKKTLKELVPDDASKAHGHGIEIRRAKNGSLRFYEGETTA